jgi:eukaryotic-like serine/threonine-protein kinase
MDKIGRYRLDRRLGAGSFATVWLGHDDDLDVPVAVKVLAENWAANDDVRNRFLAEARIMRRIHDRRIVQVYDIGTLEVGRPYFVMDFIDGGSMNDLRKQLIEPAAALRLCAEASRAIEVLHNNDVIHRDVTPGNLLLSHTPAGETRVLIADLGVAKSMVDVAGATMTAGTPSYMAYEQAAGRGQLDRRADIYSLTAVTYAMLTGSPPFTVHTIADIVARDPSVTPAPIAERLGAPPILDALMVSGLASDPNRRPPTAALLADALDGIAAQMQPQTGEATVTTAPPAGGASASQLSPVGAPPDSGYSAPDGGYAAPDGGYPLPESSYGQPERAYGQAAPPIQNYPEEPGGRSTPSSQPQGNPSYQVPAYGGIPQPQPQYAYAGAVPLGAEEQPTKRSAAYYVLVGIAAVALFAASMFVTVLLLR